jgi:hypothetical protein
MEFINQILVVLAVLSVTVEARMLYNKEIIAAVTQKMQRCQTTCVKKVSVLKKCFLFYSSAFSLE